MLSVLWVRAQDTFTFFPFLSCPLVCYTPIFSLVGVHRPFLLVTCIIIVDSDNRMKRHYCWCMFLFCFSHGLLFLLSLPSILTQGMIFLLFSVLWTICFSLLSVFVIFWINEWMSSGVLCSITIIELNCKCLLGDLLAVFMQFWEFLMLLLFKKNWPI